MPRITFSRSRFHSEHIQLLCCLLVTTFFILIFVFGMWKPEGSYDLKDQQAYTKLLHMQKEYENKLARLSEMQKTVAKLHAMFRKQFPDRLDSYEPKDLPVIFVITPTYKRPVQKAELTRLAHTLLHVPKLHWVIVEDSSNKSSLVATLLRKSGISYTHLNCGTPAEDKLKQNDPNWLKARGVLQRNKALEWLRGSGMDVSREGVVYFADDDNTYDIELFEEMRTTRTVSVWPVGLVGKLLYEAPICENGKVVGWHTYWKPDRTFAMDMAGFAINLQLILKHDTAKFSPRSLRGELESDFLAQMTTRKQLEPKADNCTKILVWHTRTEKVDLRNEARLKEMGLPGSDPKIEV